MDAKSQRCGMCMHPKPLYCPYCGARVVSDDD